MSARAYAPGDGPPNPFDQWNPQRDPRRLLEAHSADLSCRGTLDHIVPLGRKPSWPCIVVCGDGGGGGLGANAGLRQHLQNLYLYGVLRAAYMAQAHIIDSGLGSAISVVAPPTNRSDFSRGLCQVGILPSGIEEPVSRYHTHQIMLADFAGWGDRPEEFARAKFDMVRRLVGAQCRAVCILFNAGHAAFEEVEESCRLGIPCVVIVGSGPLADELCAAHARAKAKSTLESLVSGLPEEDSSVADTIRRQMYHCTDYPKLGRLVSETFPVQFGRGDFKAYLDASLGDARVDAMVESGCLYPFDASPPPAANSLQERQQLSALASLLRAHLLADTVNITRELVGGRAKRRDAILSEPMWFVRGEPRSHVRTQIGEGKLLARRGRGGQQREGGRRKRGVGRRGGSLDSSSSDSSSRTSSRLSSSSNSNNNSNDSSAMTNTFYRKEVVLLGTRRKSPTGKDGKGGGYSARFGFGDNTPRDPGAPKEWWEMTDLERAEALVVEEAQRVINRRERKLHNEILKATRKAARAAADAHCHRHLVERAAVASARRAGAAEDVARRLGKEEAAAAMHAVQSNAMQMAVIAPESLAIQKTPHLSMQERRAKAKQARESKNKPKSRRRTGILDQHLTRVRTEDEQTALEGAYRIARAVLAGGAKPEMVGRAAREAAKFVGEDVAIVLGAEAGANVLAQEAAAHGESATAIRIKARRAALGAGMKALEATHLSTKIAVDVRAADTAKRAATSGLARGEDPETLGSHALGAVQRQFPDTLSEWDARRIAGTAAGEIIATNMAAMGAGATFTSASEKEAFYGEIHKATKAAVAGAGVQAEDAHEHASGLMPEIVALHAAKAAAKRALADGGTHEDVGKAAAAAAEDATKTAAAVTGNSTNTGDGTVQAAANSIGAHAAAVIVAHDAISKGDSAEDAHAAAMNAAQGAGMSKGHSHSIAAKSASDAPLQAKALEACKDAAQKACAADLAAYQVGLICVSAARQAGLSETAAQTLGAEVAQITLRDRGKDSGKDTDLLAADIEQSERGASLNSCVCDIVIFRCREDMCCRLDDGRDDGREGWGDGLEVWWEGKSRQELKQHYADAHPQKNGDPLTHKYVQQRCGFQCHGKRELREHAAKSHQGTHVCMFREDDDGGELYCGKTFPIGWMLASHIKEDHLHEDHVAECDALLQSDADIKTMVNVLTKKNPGLDEETVADTISKNFSPAFRGRLKNLLLGVNIDEDENGDRFECADADQNMCTERFKTRDAMEAHRKVAHPRAQGDFWCATCAFACTSAMAIKVHYRKLHPNYRYPCNGPGLIADQCGKVFISAAKRDKHVKKAHEIIDASGKISHVAAKDDSMGLQTRIRSTRGLTKCGICFESGTALESHVKNVHKDTFDCKNPANSHPSCAHKFTSIDEAVLHAKVRHTNFPCMSCNKMCKTELERQLHIKDAHAEMERCQYCHQTFSNTARKKEHEERRHRCKHCDYRCCASRVMDLHLAATHAKFRCPLCPKLCDSREKAAGHHTVCQAAKREKTSNLAKGEIGGDGGSGSKKKERKRTHKHPKQNKGIAADVDVDGDGNGDGGGGGEEKIADRAEEEAAATKIEARMRGRKDRARVKKMREDKAKQDAGEAGEKKGAVKKGTAEEEAAAVKIEARMRGRKDRAKVKKMREDKAKQDAAKGGEGSKGQNDAAALIQAKHRGYKDRERVEMLKTERVEKKEKERLAEVARIEAAKKLQARGPQPPKCVLAGHDMVIKKGPFEKGLTCNVCCKDAASEMWLCTACTTSADTPPPCSFCFECAPKDGVPVWIKGSTCAVPEDFKTVDAALDRAKLSGGEITKIVVARGTHKVGTTNCGSQQKTPCLCMWNIRGMHIVGAGIGKTVLEGLVHCKDDGISHDTKSGLDRELRLEGLTITNKKGTGLWIGKKGACLKCVNVEFAENKSNGALVDDSDGRFVRCQFNKNGRNGCLVFGGSANLTSCKASEQVEAGILFQKGATGLITKLTATKNKGPNIALSEAGTVATLRNSVLQTSKHHGVSVTAGAVLLIKGHKTKITDNAKHGCFAEGVGSTISLGFRKGYDHSEGIDKWVVRNKFKLQLGVMKGAVIDDDSGNFVLRSKVPADMELVAPTCLKKHALVLQSMDTKKKWDCSGGNNKAGCKVGNDVSGKKQWRCGVCDFNYCGPCYNANTQERKISLIKQNGFPKGKDGKGKGAKKTGKKGKAKK